MQYLYLGILLFSIFGISILDWRYKLAFWHNKKQSLHTILLGMLFFVTWDMAGILLGIFFHGDSRYALHFKLAPEFPLEELFFLFLLLYVSLVTWRLLEEKC